MSKNFWRVYDERGPVTIDLTTVIYTDDGENWYYRQVTSVTPTQRILEINVEQKETLK